MSTTSAIYNFLRLLNRALSYSTTMTDDRFHEMLFMLFKQAQSLSTNHSRIIQWMKSDLSLIVHPNDATLLIRYLQLFLPLPSESLNQTDSFQQFILANPLQLQIILSPSLSKKEWCEKMDAVISERTLAINKERYFLINRLCSFLRASIPCPLSAKRISPIPFVADYKTDFKESTIRSPDSELSPSPVNCHPRRVRFLFGPRDISSLQEGRS
jgi:hypothetical protein